MGFDHECMSLPGGQTKAPTKASDTTKASYEELKEKRAWDFAISPAKSLPMQAFMLYMSGGGVQIFSMSIVFMLLLTPFKNLAAINEGRSHKTSRHTLDMIPCSFRPVRPLNSQPEIIKNARTSETSLPRLQHSNSCARIMEM
jgi:hypothetical protein